MPIAFEVEVDRFPIAGKFVIARGSRTEAVVVRVTLRDGDAVGQGECVPYARYDETVDGVVAQIEAVAGEIADGMTHVGLQAALPAGAARNAIDCALWDLSAKTSGVRVADQIGIGEIPPATTCYTISLGTPDEMAEHAAAAADRPILKVKFGGPGGDLDRIRAVRAAAPDATLVCDANEGWHGDALRAHLVACAEAGFAMVEQPVPASDDRQLSEHRGIVPLCADESVHDRPTLDRLVGLYDIVNIKLDKTGGLTEALALADAAEERGFDLMIGCMVGSSLAMAPAMMLSPRCEFVDLDGPLLLARDRDPALRYDGSTVYPPDPGLWG